MCGCGKVIWNRWRQVVKSFGEAPMWSGFW